MLKSNYLPDNTFDALIAKMEKKRIIPVVAFKLTLVAFALALTTLLIGITGNHPNSPAILTVRPQTLLSSSKND